MKKKISELSFVYLCVLACIFGEILLNRYVLTLLPLCVRLLCRLPAYRLIAAVPLIFCVRGRISPEELGFSKQNLLRQTAIGLVLGLGMSALLTGLPHLLGFGDLADDGSRFTRLWQYLYTLFYDAAAVSLTEEFIFRGYFYSRLREILPNDRTVVLVSSVLFGFSHVFQGNVIQVIMTALLGAVWCVMRLKIKNCSTLSLIIAHGVYDALISAAASLLLR